VGLARAGEPSAAFHGQAGRDGRGCANATQCYAVCVRYVTWKLFWSLPGSRGGRPRAGEELELGARTSDKIPHGRLLTAVGKAVGINEDDQRSFLSSLAQSSSTLSIGPDHSIAPSSDRGGDRRFVLWPQEP
jgi:hypothetical protein